MNRIAKVTRLHLNKWDTFLVVPVSILVIVWVVTLIVQIAIQRSTGVDPVSAEYAADARWNSAIAWSLPGFLVYYGVQAVATTYPFALALGTTRRDFVAGTMIANAVQSAYIALLLLALLGLELATGHWFAGLYLLDVYIMGAGDPLVLAATAFLGVMFFLTIGGFFAAIWVRFGNRGPAIAGIALALVLAIALLIAAPRLGEIFAGITRGTVALTAGIVIVAALVGTWFAMRRASVR